MIARLWSLVDKRALLVSAGCIVVLRILEQIPVTDLSTNFIAPRLALYAQPGFFAAIGSNSLLFSAYSIGYLGIGPYVNALVLMSLLGVVFSRVRDRFATPDGRLSLTRWTRGLALVLALGQAYTWTYLAQSVGALSALDWSGRLLVCTELTAGTAVTILLAGLMDEFGLGFGYSAFIFYAIQIVGQAVHRLADMLATGPSFDVTAKSLLFGSAWSLAACAGCVAVLLAVRRMAPTGKTVKQQKVAEIPIVVSGVFRPGQFAFAVLFLPTMVANYYVTLNIPAVHWFVANWAPLGPSPWLDAVYIAFEFALVVLFALFAVAYDGLVIRPAPYARRLLLRLAVISGLAIAVLVVMVPIRAQLFETRVKMLIPLGGFSLLIVVTMILIVIRAVEGRPLRLASLFP